MTLKKRINRLTNGTGGGANLPSFVFLCEAYGEAHVALVRGGGSVSREPHETEPSFKIRVFNCAASVVLAINGGDTQPTRKAAKRTQSPLTL